MSFIDTENYFEMETTATISALARVLEKEGYKVTKSSKRISATKGGIFSSHTSTITVVDLGNIREISDLEQAKGYMMKPKSDRLTKIVIEAEDY